MGLGAVRCCDLGLRRSGQAGRENGVFLLAGETTGLRCEGIIVFADDVNLLPLFLRRPAAQGFELGAVIPIGTTRPALSTGTTRPESRPPWG